MGVRASLEIIEESTLKDILAGGNPKTLGIKYYLDKAWYELHVILSKEFSLLKSCISGDISYPFDSPAFKQFINGESDYYCGFASKGLVCQMAKEFATIDEAKFKTCYENHFHDDLDYVQSHFEQLRLAYTEAAEHDKVVMILIC